MLLEVEHSKLILIPIEVVGEILLKEQPLKEQLLKETIDACGGGIASQGCRKPVEPRERAVPRYAVSQR